MYDSSESISKNIKNISGDFTGKLSSIKDGKEFYIIASTKNPTKDQPFSKDNFLFRIRKDDIDPKTQRQWDSAIGQYATIQNGRDFSARNSAREPEATICFKNGQIITAYLEQKMPTQPFSLDR
jgi:hypothetical protein